MVHTVFVRALGALRDWAGVAVGAASLVLAALLYDSCDKFGAAPYAYVVVAGFLGALTSGIAESERSERVRAAAFAGVVVALAGVGLLMVLFSADGCSGA